MGSSRIISFASKSLTPTERKYAQNQREALAAVWAVEHYSYFLLGRKFTLRTDAQGVSFILNRQREDSKRALTRADGWALRLSPYRYDVEYIRGTDNIADPPSRLYIGDDDAFDDDASPWEVAVLEANVVGFLTDNEVKSATSEDQDLQGVISSLRSNCWPTHLRQFQLLESDLSIHDGMLIKTGCVVVPEVLRKRALTISHEGHPSVAKQKSILRQRVWWPGMSADAQRWVESCETCAIKGKPERPTPMQRVFAPKAVWETIALDFNGPYVRFGGISILVIVDYRSRYLIAQPVKSTSFEHTKKVLEQVFDREGIPKFMKSDNGPPFNGEEYKSFCTKHGITPVFSTPLFPQQNGLVEGYMKLINKAMVSASVNKTNYIEELRSAVHAHNAATHSVTKFPPEEVLSGRKIKRGLPLLEYRKATVDDELLNDRDRRMKLLGKEREDKRRGARQCRVKPGDKVIVERTHRGKGESRFSPLQYTVIDEKNGSLTISGGGHTIKRHVTQTKRVQDWRKPDDSDTARATNEGTHQPTAANGAEAELTTRTPRNTRSKKAPAYLQEYVRSIELN
ncbi:uncharacterized protein K02A2.6-like [Armigeres subalbatus]|uniref:uncharacterized protein K02A2.6-like n=1 Tax=Armigeres subalbatus TaxID=124917 RepID=UPI002ED1876C